MTNVCRCWATSRKNAALASRAGAVDSRSSRGSRQKSSVQLPGDCVTQSHHAPRASHPAPSTQHPAPSGLFVSWPDIKLSLRLLIRNPGLTVVSTVGITVGIAIASAMFGYIHSNFDPPLPLDEGDRIVALENWDFAGNNENRKSLHDFVTWRDQMTSVVEISAFREISATMRAGDFVPETVRIAAMSASGFRVARVPALLGRYLTPDDEREAAPPVVVIGYDVWKSRFGQDRSVIGQQVRFGITQYTIVGVMPEGFAFPVNHQYLDPAPREPVGDSAWRRPGAVCVRTAGAGRDDGVGSGGAVGHRTAHGRGVSTNECDAEAAGAELHRTDQRHSGHDPRAWW